MPINGTDVVKMKAFIEAGLSDQEICVQEGWSLNDTKNLRKKALFEEEERFVGKRTEEVYAEYLIRSESHIRMLANMVDLCLTSNQASAAVGAVKAMQDILEKRIALGQKFGLVKEKSSGGSDVSRMSIPELKVFIDQRQQSIQTLVQSYGDIPFKELSAPNLRAMQAKRLDTEKESGILRRKVSSRIQG